MLYDHWGRENGRFLGTERRNWGIDHETILPGGPFPEKRVEEPFPESGLEYQKKRVEKLDPIVSTPAKGSGSRGS